LQNQHYHSKSWRFREKKKKLCAQKRAPIIQKNGGLMLKITEP